MRWLKMIGLTALLGGLAYGACLFPGDQVPGSPSSFDYECDDSGSGDPMTTWVNQGTATITYAATKGFCDLKAPQGSAVNVRARVQTAPSNTACTGSGAPYTCCTGSGTGTCEPYDIIARIDAGCAVQTYNFTGIVLRHSADDKMLMFGPGNTGDVPIVNVEYFNGATSDTSNPKRLDHIFADCYRVHVTSTDWTFYISHRLCQDATDGTWEKVGSTTAFSGTLGAAPDQIGWGAMTVDNVTDCHAILSWFRVQ